MNINLLTVVFFTASFFYTLMAFHTVSLNSKYTVNKIFFVFALVLAEWAMCFAVMTSASSNGKAIALFYNKISVLGWGVVYSVFYHFLTVLEKKKIKLSLKFYLLVYIPALLNVLFFLCLGETSNQQFDMQLTPWGWTSRTPSTLYNIYFSAYALIFSLLSLFKILIWSKKVKDKDISKDIKFIGFFYTIAFILGSTTDIILNRILGMSIVQMTILWLLLPTIAIFYILVKHKIIQVSQTSSLIELLDEKKRRQLFQFTGWFYFLISYFTLLTNYFLPDEKTPNQILWSFAIYLLAGSHFFLKRIFKKISDQYLFLNVTSIVAIILLSLKYNENNSIIGLGIFFYYILIASILDKKHYPYIIASITIFMQIFNWYLHPTLRSEINWVYYVTRILIIVISTFVVGYVNRIYRNKIDQYSDHVKTQNILSQISGNLIEANIDNLKTKIEVILNICNNHFIYARSYYYRVSKKALVVDLISYADSMGEYPAESKTIYNNAITGEIFTGVPITVGINQDTNKPTEKIRNYLSEMGITGFHAIPIMLNNIVKGVLVFEFKGGTGYSSVCDYREIISNLITDAIRRTEYEQKLFDEANYDKITGLLNRNGFINEINIIMNKTALQYSALIFLDIDNFRTINEAFTHSMGDIILICVANMLKGKFAKEGIISRLSKDEFCLFFPHSESREILENKLHSILKMFETPISIMDYKFMISINMGVAVYPDDGNSVSDLLKSADLALNKAKKVKKMSFYFCTAEDKDKTTKNLIYTNRLFNVIANNELMMVYQPQMNLKTGKIVGVEALVRWKSPEFGLVSPGEFIPILERTGLIIKVGEWILQQVAKQQKKMISEGMPKIRFSVNLSAVQFQDDKLIDKLNSVLNNWVVDTDYFELEITESATANDNNSLIAKFNKIKETGCSIAIDDFGVEFSSLNRLQELPIDRLKVDKSFVDGIGIDEKREKIIKIIIELAHSLNLESIAEGVETEEQLNFLKELNCMEIQGYYYSKPLFTEDFENFVKLNS